MMFISLYSCIRCRYIRQYIMIKFWSYISLNREGSAVTTASATVNLMDITFIPPSSSWWTRGFVRRQISFRHHTSHIIFVSFLILLLERQTQRFTRLNGLKYIHILSHDDGYFTIFKFVWYRYIRQYITIIPTILLLHVHHFDCFLSTSSCRYFMMSLLSSINDWTTNLR